MARTRLSPEEEAAWRGLNEMRAQLMSKVAKDLAVESGLTEADYAVLLAIVESPGRAISSPDLLARLRWEPSRLSHQLRRMQTRGTIARETSAEDARSFTVTITERGLHAIGRATPGHFRSVRRWFVDALTPEQLSCLAEIARSVSAHLDAMEKDENAQA